MRGAILTPPKFGKENEKLARKIVTRLSLLFVFTSLLLILVACGEESAREMILATTTSTQDSGLLDFLIPKFESEFSCKVKIIAVGTGEALAMGQRGDADVLLVHARAAEDQFMAAGYGSLRKDVMYNDFLLVGPTSDPAQAKGTDIITALKKIAQAGTFFVSRGDNSGTHKKELELWKKASITPTGSWYLSTGQGMGETARIASEKQGYTLIDRGTYLTLKSSLQLIVISEKDEMLFNPYGVIVVNPDKFPNVHSAEALKFASWITSSEVQKLIGEFGVDKFGEPLFVPNASP